MRGAPGQSCTIAFATPRRPKLRLTGLRLITDGVIPDFAILLVTSGIRELRSKSRTANVEFPCFALNVLPRVPTGSSSTSFHSGKRSEQMHSKLFKYGFWGE